MAKKEEFSDTQKMLWKYFLPNWKKVEHFSYDRKARVFHRKRPYRMSIWNLEFTI